jgi:Rhs element Vgr protein
MANESTIPTVATPDVCTVAILVDGQELSGEYHVLSVVVEREVNRIPYAKVVVQDGEAAKATFVASNSALFVPGKVIEIQLGYRSQNTKVFKGIIVKHSLKMRKAASQLMFECKDVVVKMTTGVKSKYFVEKKDSVIIEELIATYSDLTKNVEATKPDLKEIVQYQASDWDFLLCRAEANGLVVMVEDGKVNVATPVTSASPALEVRYGATLLEFDAEIDVRWQSKGIKSTSWNAADQALLSTDAKEPQLKTGGNLKADELALVVGDDLAEIKHGGQLAVDELQAWADGRLLRERLAKVRGRARFQGFAAILPGNMIKVTGVGERFEGEIYLSAVRQTVVNGNWETDVQFGLSAEMFSLAQHVNALPASGLIPAVSGLQIGIVTALQDDPAGEERIKIKLPMVGTEDEGIWARVSTLDAGPDRGTFFRPEIGDEVMVGFLNDDPRYPVVLGMLHSSKNNAPEPANDDNNIKGYVSREKLKMTFDDEKKIMHFETPGGNQMVFSEEDKGIVIQDQNGNKITMSEDGIQFESIKDLTFKASKDMKVEGLNIEMKAQSTMKMSGTSSAELAGASVTVQASGNAVLKGGVVQIN